MIFIYMYLPYAIHSYVSPYDTHLYVYLPYGIHLHVSPLLSSFICISPMVFIYMYPPYGIH